MFEILYQLLDLNGKLSYEAADHEKIKKAFTKTYGALNRPKDLIYVNVNACYKRKYLNKSLFGMRFIYKNVNVKDAARYKLFQRAVQNIKKLHNYLHLCSTE